MTDESFEGEHIEESLEPGPGVPWGGIIGTVGIILLVVFAVQNTEDVRVEFLWMSGDFPLAIVILVTAVVASLLAMLTGTLYRRRRARRKAEQQELRQFREEN